jgi:hypothetical protein
MRQAAASLSLQHHHHPLALYSRAAGQSSAFKHDKITVSSLINKKTSYTFQPRRENMGNNIFHKYIIMLLTK